MFYIKSSPFSEIINILNCTYLCFVFYVLFHILYSVWLHLDPWNFLCLCVSVCVCAHVLGCVCMCKCYVCMRASMHVCIYVCIYLCVYVRTYVCMHGCMKCWSLKKFWLTNEKNNWSIGKCNSLLSLWTITAFKIPPAKIKVLIYSKS
jgi:hypothetical protein